jgi:hypothetical protein
MTKSLTDYCLLRSNELTCILAGCVALDTFNALKVIEKLHDESLTDLKARSFIIGMRNKLTELQAADEAGIVQIIIEIARENNCLFDYAYWLTIVKDAKKDAKEAVRELQGIAITLHTLKSLQAWIKEQEAYYERR